jgi:hypothetical protein
MGHIRSLLEATPYINTKRETWCHLLTGDFDCEALGDVSKELLWDQAKMAQWDKDEGPPRG